jgi:hypothetical protein
VDPAEVEVGGLHQVVSELISIYRFHVKGIKEIVWYHQEVSTLISSVDFRERR